MSEIRSGQVLLFVHHRWLITRGGRGEGRRGQGICHDDSAEIRSIRCRARRRGTFGRTGRRFGRTFDGWRWHHSLARWKSQLRGRISHLFENDRKGLIDIVLVKSLFVQLLNKHNDQQRQKRTNISAFFVSIDQSESFPSPSPPSLFIVSDCPQPTRHSFPSLSLSLLLRSHHVKRAERRKRRRERICRYSIEFPAGLIFLSFLLSFRFDSIRIRSSPDIKSNQITNLLLIEVIGQLPGEEEEDEICSSLYRLLGVMKSRWFLVDLFRINDKREEEKDVGKHKEEEEAELETSANVYSDFFSRELFEGAGSVSFSVVVRLGCSGAGATRELLIFVDDDFVGLSW